MDGIETGTTSAPHSASVSMAARTVSATRGSTPAPKNSSGTPTRFPFASGTGSCSYGRPRRVVSRGSGPEMTRSRDETSPTVRPMGPIVSSEFAYATRPYRETRPYVGFRPTMPQNAAGQRTEPPVSVPRARSARPDATAAAEPPEEPPGTRETSRGLRVGP